MPDRKVFLCGTIDTLLVVMITFAIAAYEGLTPLGLFAEKGRFLLTFVMPISVLVGWRGGAHASRLVGGQRSWFRPALEGFAWGFLVIPVTQVIGIISEAFAAGPPWPTPGYSSLQDWFRYFGYLLQISAALGGVGVVVALTVSSINRLLLRWLGAPLTARSGTLQE